MTLSNNDQKEMTIEQKQTVLNHIELINSTLHQIDSTTPVNSVIDATAVLPNGDSYVYKDGEVLEYHVKDLNHLDKC